MITLPDCFDRRQLRDLGVGAKTLTAMLRAGDVVQPVRGVYVPFERADDPLVRARAVGRALPPGAAVARETAAWVHGVDCRPPGTLDRPLPMHAVVATGREPPAHRGIVAHVDRLPSEDVVCVAGIPVTTPARTLLDLARFQPVFMGLAAADALARDFGLDPAELSDRLEQWRGQRHVVRARRVLDLCEPETESFGESWTRLRLVDAGFPRPEPQIWVHDRDGVALYRLDLGWRERRVAVEYDGEEFHSEDADVEHDGNRRGVLERTHDWRVLVARKGEVLGRRMDLELAAGELLGLEPQISWRRW